MTNPPSPHPGVETSGVPGVGFRSFQGEADLGRLLEVLVASERADGFLDPLSLGDLAAWCAPSHRFDPARDLVLAVGPGAGEAPDVIGFSRLTWYTGRAGLRIYHQDSYLLPGWRAGGVWPAMVRRSERRMREIAALQAPPPQRIFQGWATEAQVQWISTLEGAGYRAVRHFHNMLRPLDQVPEAPLPPGLEVRPVRPDHYRPIWEAQKEVHEELFETVAEHWVEERYPAWRDRPSHTPDLWQVAWQGDQVAGMVLARIDAAANREGGRKRGFTEHVFVRRPWRRLGLARALMARSLQVLQAQGMEEAELGVDSENDSGAYDFYTRLGYQTYRTDLWFRRLVDGDPRAG